MFNDVYFDIEKVIEKEIENGDVIIGYEKENKEICSIKYLMVLTNDSIVSLFNLYEIELKSTYKTIEDIKEDSNFFIKLLANEGLEYGGIISREIINIGNK